jgi:transposase
MSYVVEQKIKGRIYLYEAESYWDKVKKQPRQRRKYIGPKEAKNKALIKQKPVQLISKNYGNISLLNFISTKLGIKEILKNLFPESFLEILALAYYEIMEGSALYLFPYWIDEQNLPDAKKLYSSGISDLCDNLGRLQARRFEFVQKWIERLKPINGIFYDITSISSYSTNIDFIEWGYNRDKEKLPQLNMGVVFCQNNLLPIFYNLYSGSIVDVTTLKNCIKYLSIFDLKDILFVLDKGFFSKSNISELNNNENNFKFIQPVPFRLIKVKELIKKVRKQLLSPEYAFKFNEEILYYLTDSLELDQVLYDAHIYFNEKADLNQRHNFLSSLLTIEDKFKNRKFKTLQEYITYKKSEIPEKYTEYFKWNMKTLEIVKNTKKIREYISSMGCFIILTNQKNMEKSDVLNFYRRRDMVEKLFDIVKNEMDGDRLRVHSNYNTEGRLFIKFVALIIYMEISKTMQRKKLFEKYSFKELISELKKIKITIIDNNEPIISELTKKQKIILDAFDIKEEVIT